MVNSEKPMIIEMAKCNSSSGCNNGAIIFDPVDAINPNKSRFGVIRKCTEVSFVSNRRFVSNALLYFSNRIFKNTIEIIAIRINQLDLQ